MAEVCCNHFTLFLFTTPTEELCVNVSCGSKENQLILQNGEINHRHHAGIHSNLTNECKKDSTIEEEMDIETFLITEGNKAQKALGVVYENILLDCRLPPPPPPPMLYLYLD